MKIKVLFDRFAQIAAEIVSPDSQKAANTAGPSAATTRFTFLPVGFHGDRYLLDVVDALAQDVDMFVETGTNVGSTLAYFARKHPHIPCLSCEPDLEAFQHAQKNVSDLTNITLYNQTSQQFLETLREKHGDIFKKKVLFWLDAHGYGFQWPLKEELAFISGNFLQALILIDDFKVPGREMFGYDEYQGQICSYEYIKDALNPARTYKVYYPNYTEHTSLHHPLRGWGLIAYHQEQGLRLPERIQGNIRLSTSEENSPPSYGKMAVRDRLGEIKSRITNPQPLIIDGGANLGSITDALLGYYPSAIIHAFEPIPHLADALRAKYAHRPNVVTHAKALGAEPKTLTFHQLNSIDSSSFLTPSAIKKKYHGQKVAVSNELTVEQVRVDDMVDGDIDILKLDLQGYELEALKGAERSLPSTKLVLIEVEFVPLYENQPLFGDIDVFLRERGFFLLNLYELWTHPDGQLTSGDAIYLNSRYFKP